MMKLPYVQILVITLTLSPIRVVTEVHVWPGAVGDGEQSTQSAGSQPPITPEPSKGQGQVEDSDFRKDSKKLSIVFLKCQRKSFLWAEIQTLFSSPRTST